MSSLVGQIRSSRNPIHRLGAAVFALGFVLATDPALAQETLSPGDGAEPAVSVESLPSAVAQFTTAIENREPVDQITFVESDIGKVYFFSDLRGLAGKTVTHRWSHRGQTTAEVDFEVRGPRWRVWSSKEMEARRTGDWTVEIVVDGEEVLAAETFTYITAPD